MRFSTTLRLLLAACVLAGVIWLVDRRKPSVEKLFVMDLKDADVASLTLESGDLRVECSRKGSSWFLEKPIKVKADDAKIDRIIGSLETMSRRETVTREQRDDRRLTLRDYGLHKPRVKLTVGSMRGGVSCRDELFIGSDAPLGDSIYVKFATNDEVIGTSRSIIEVIPDKIEVLRDRAVLHGDVSKTSRIEIKRASGGFIQLMHTPQGWCIQQPIIARADGMKVQQLLEAMYSLKVEDFVWDATAGTSVVERVSERITNPDAQVETYRLTPDEAVVRVTVWSNGSDSGKEVFFGKETGEKGEKIYARCSDVESIYAVSKKIMEVIGLGLNDLRDKNLFAVSPVKVKQISLARGDRKLTLNRVEKEGWVITEPVRWKADDQYVGEMIGKLARLRVESFPDSTNQADFALGQPSIMIHLSESLPLVAAGLVTNSVQKKEGKEEPGKETVAAKGRLLIAPVQEGRDRVAVKFEDEPYILEIARSSIDFLDKDPVDPLIYRDRLMLALESASVRRISLVKAGLEQTIEKNAAGEWTCVVPATNQVDKKAVDEVLFAAANMRAVRTECQNPGNLVQYGLDSSGTTLTFGLTGETAIQKTLVMGFRARNDGVYAMIQGLDVVFVISNGLMNLLAGDLTKFSPPVRGP